MDRFVIEGKSKLKGRVQIKGAKNSMLPIMAASVLSAGPGDIVLENIPNLKDMHIMMKILRAIGVEATYEDNTLCINPSTIELYSIPEDLMSEMRSSIFLMGPVLARLGKVKFTSPGGCSIGPRPIDLHLKGLEALGAKIWEEKGFIFVSAPRLQGAEIHLDYPSVGATENLMMTAALAKGRTIINNAAKEPEIVDLQNFLNTMGAKVRGGGTETLRINGVESLYKCKYSIIPDRIVAGTYLMAGAITGGKVRVENVIPTHLDAVIAKLKEAGVNIYSGDDFLEVDNGSLQAVDTLRTLPYPGFPTDLQAQMMALLSLAKGKSVIVESVFESRFRHVDELRRMGADITTEDREAVVQGVDALYGAEVNSADLRAGAALVLAGLAAEGVTTVTGVNHIDRGYEKFEETLNQLGANITRVNDNKGFNKGRYIL